MKNQTMEKLIGDQPYDYYCIVSKEYSEASKQLPEFAVNGKIRFIEEPLRLYNSKKLAARACRHGEEPLALICLCCFLNIVRSRLAVRTAILNDHFHCSIEAWRTPCQTTALINEEGRRYYVEGCRDTGVFWRPVEVKPTTPPPFIVCGAQHLDCLLHSCPNGWVFMDDEPITLCDTQHIREPIQPFERCRIRFETPEVSMFYAGISREGFDFIKDRERAAVINAKDANRIATAIANVQINWSRGMMSAQQGCRVVIVDEQDKELVSIK